MISKVLQFIVVEEESGFSARAELEDGGGLNTEGDSWSELINNIAEAVECYCGSISLIKPPIIHVTLPRVILNHDSPLKPEIFLDSRIY